MLEELPLDDEVEMDADTAGVELLEAVASLELKELDEVVDCRIGPPVLDSVVEVDV